MTMERMDEPTNALQYFLSLDKEVNFSVGCMENQDQDVPIFFCAWGITEEIAKRCLMNPDMDPETPVEVRIAILIKREDLIEMVDALREAGTKAWGITP